MNETAGGSCGTVAWELVDVSTGEVRPGRRELRTTDFEVVVFPPPPPPHLGLLRGGPRQLAADTLGWLVRAGRGSTTKSVRLADGFWLVLRELRTPSRAALVLLSAKRETTRLSCVERFRVDEGGATASQVEQAGSLGLEWAHDQDGFQELIRITTANDVTLRLRSSRGPIGREPVWLVRILAGSTIDWPRSADGVRLVPRLRPDRSSSAEPR